MRYDPIVLAASAPLLVLALAAASGASPPEGWIALTDDLRVRPLAEDLWLHESDSQWGDSTVAANGLVVRGRDGALVVDTPWTEEQTAKLLGWIGRELGAAVLGVVATHFHPDSLGGIAEAHRRGIATWGQTATGPLAVANDREAPTKTFDDRVSLSTGSETVEAAYLGPGHARDNIVVWLPARRVLYGGCAVKAVTWTGLGFTGDADLERWPDTVRAMTAFDPEIVIPGHGPPGGPELLAHTLELLAARD
ncbi:MAG: subclass B1 metallo-beta-lactamase [Acidobacteriota bacterium]|nr:subclass B1 metallo-beta-lactamase [Acidobacteriota bacterium]MDH3525191.1 subclass B1 metallo-beta-lactamase [Acidobacteriota bacterium]